MIKTGLDALTVLYQLLKGSTLELSMSGGIYKRKRPLGSSLEDIVINDLPFTADQFQVGTLNVNLYVPDTIVLVSTQEQGFPNEARLEQLMVLATPLLGEVYSNQYNFWLTNSTTIEEPESKSHYINLRIDFQFFPS